jgi:twitching motility protein PilJ
LGAALIASFVLMLILFGLYAVEARKNSAQIAAATEMQMLAQRLARGGAQSEMGGAAGFDVLQSSREQFRGNLKALATGGDYRGVAVSEPQSEGVRNSMSELEKRWGVVDVKVDELVAARSILTSLSQAVSNVNQGNQGLLELAEQLATQLSNSSGREFALANNLVMLTQRIAKNANALIGDEVDSDVAFLLGKDTATFRDIVNGLLQGSEALRVNAIRDGEARQTLTELGTRFQETERRLVEVLRAMPRLLAGKQAAKVITTEAEPLMAGAQVLSSAYEGAGNAANYALFFAAFFGLLSLLLGAALGYLFLSEARVRAAANERENQRNQEAILRAHWPMVI